MRPVRTRGVLGALGGCVALGAGAYGFSQALDLSRKHAAAQRELRQQAAELNECRSRLRRLYAAWTRYRREHGGTEPPSIDALVPRYVPDPHLFVCPTGLRLLKQGRRVQRGVYQRGRRIYPVSYGFVFLSSGNAFQVRHLGERAPLVICDTHREAVFRAVYGRAVPLGAFDSARRSAWLPEVVNAPVLEVRRNGEIDNRADPD